MLSEKFWKKWAAHPGVVLSIYAFFMIPLALYVFHDLLNKRWTPVQKLKKFLIMYSLLYVGALAALIVYCVFQAKAEEFREMGAVIVAISLGSYQALKLMRLFFIIRCHKGLVNVASMLDNKLSKMAGVSSLNISMEGMPFERHFMLSTAVFDDDYPGEAGARIHWLPGLSPGSWRVGRVEEQDTEIAASRVALWLRLILNRGQIDPYGLYLSSNLVCTDSAVRHRPFLGYALKRLAQYRSVNIEFRRGFSAVETLLRGKLNLRDFNEIGRNFFCFASRMSDEEMSQALAEMPPQWVRDVDQNGRSLMIEISIFFLLFSCSHREQAPLVVSSGLQPAEDKSLKHLLSIANSRWEDNLKKDDIWDHIGQVCAEAIVNCHPRLHDMPKEEIRTIHTATKTCIKFLRDQKRDQEEEHGVFSFGIPLLELICTSYRAEKVLQEIYPPGMEEEQDSYQGELWKAEICLGLACMLTENFNINEEAQRHLSDWRTRHDLDLSMTIREALYNRPRRSGDKSIAEGTQKRLKFWVAAELEEKCHSPGKAFKGFFEIGSGLVPVLCSIFRSNVYLRNIF